MHTCCRQLGPRSRDDCQTRNTQKKVGIRHARPSIPIRWWWWWICRTGEKEKIDTNQDKGWLAHRFALPCRYDIHNHANEQDNLYTTNHPIVSTDSYLQISRWVKEINLSVGRRSGLSPSPVSTPQTVVKFGYLLYKKAHNKWAQKFFVLERNLHGVHLSYYDSVAKQKLLHNKRKLYPERVIPLRYGRICCNVCPMPGGKKTPADMFGFVISGVQCLPSIPRSTSRSKYSLCAYSEGECLEWIAAVRDVIGTRTQVRSQVRSPVRSQVCLLPPVASAAPTSVPDESTKITQVNCRMNISAKEIVRLVKIRNAQLRQLEQTNI